MSIWLLEMLAAEGNVRTRMKRLSGITLSYS